MDSASRPGARPDELVTLLLALEERDRLDAKDRRRLDQEVMAAVVDGASDGVLLRHWVASAPNPRIRERARRIRSALGLVRSFLAAAGVFFGWAMAAALLQVEVHAGRVNIVLCVTLLVAVPGVMLGAALVGLAVAQIRDRPASPLAWREWALARGALRLLSQSVREDVERVLGRAARSDRLLADLRRAQLFAWSQWLGLGFAVGALVAALLHVVFTDLAFGWSTTLDIDATFVHGLVEGLSKPWAALWPEASPSFDLVESTRHFRVETGAPHVHFIDPIRYGGWWPFLVMALAAYALAPRVLATAWGEWRLGRVAGATLLRTPGVGRLLDGLRAPRVETRAEAPEGEIGRAAGDRVEAIDLADWRQWNQGAGGDASGPDAIRAVIVWAESIDDETIARRLGWDALRVRDAGGRRTLEEDAEAIAATRDAQGPVTVFVRAYEPPVLELLDFLGDLRGALGGERRIVVALRGGGEADRDGWRRKLATLGDPRLVVLACGEEA